jgi:hypothetical protein
LGVSAGGSVANGLELGREAKGLVEEVDQGLEEPVPKADVEPKVDCAMGPNAFEVDAACRPENADCVAVGIGAGVSGLGVAGAVTKGVGADDSSIEPNGWVAGATISSIEGSAACSSSPSTPYSSTSRPRVVLEPVGCPFSLQLSHAFSPPLLL